MIINLLAVVLSCCLHVLGDSCCLANDEIRCIGQKLILSDVIHLRLLSEAFGVKQTLALELKLDV